MMVRVLTFARVREIVGAGELEIELPENATIADLNEVLIQSHPRLEEVIRHCNFSIDQEYSSAEARLTNGCEVGIIPPVSGG